VASHDVYFNQARTVELLFLQQPPRWAKALTKKGRWLLEENGEVVAFALEGEISVRTWARVRGR